MRVIEFLLIACLWAAALGIGGTEVYTFAAVQFVLLASAAVLLWVLSADREGKLRLPWMVPVLLIVLVLAQHIGLAQAGYSARPHLPRLLTVLAAFYLAAVLSYDGQARSRLLAALAGLGLLEAIYGMVQYLANWHQIFTLKKAFYTAHATGTYVNPNHFAGLLEMILPLVLAAALYRWEWWAARSGSRRMPHIGDHAEGMAQAALLSALAVAMFAAILFSRSRTGMFSATVAAGILALAWLCSTPQRHRAALILAGMLSVALALGAWIGMGPVFERFVHLEADTVPRLSVWRDTLVLVRARPWLGAGFGSFADVYPQVQSTLLGKRVEHAHNDYLQAAVELGIPAAVILFAAMVALALRGLVFGAFRTPARRERFQALGCATGVLALLVHSAADFNLQLPANAMVFAVLLGVLWTLTHGLGHTEQLAGTMVTGNEPPRSARTNRPAKSAIPSFED